MMNSKVLQDKIKSIEGHQTEMRLLKEGEKSHPGDHHPAVPSGECQSSVSLKHYDQVIILIRNRIEFRI